MRNKKVIFILSILIVAVASSLLYISYGFVTSKIEGNTTAKKFANISQILKIQYSDGTNNITNAKDSYFIPGSVLTKTFTIKNTGNVDLNFKIRLIDVVNTFIRTDLTYELYLGDTLINSSALPSTDETIAYNQFLEINETKEYTLKIIYNESEENQIVDQGKNISASIAFEQQEDHISNIKVLGNSIQESIPTDYNIPMEIQSVGNKVENLLDYSKNYLSSSTQLTKRSYDENYLDVYSKRTYDYVYVPVTLKANKTYTLWYEYTVYDRAETATGNTIIQMGFKISGQSSSQYVNSNGTYQSLYKYTPTEDMSVDILFQANYGSAVPAKVKFRAMLLEGDYSYDNLPDYVAYNNSKYDVPVKIQGKNIIRPMISYWNKFGVRIKYDEKDNTYILNGTSTLNGRAIINSLSDYGTNNFAELKTGDPYTLSAQPIVSENGNVAKLSLDYSFSYSSTLTYAGVSVASFSRLSKSITAHRDMNFSRFYIDLFDGAVYDNLKIKFQVEKGKTATDFEPHIRDTSILLDEPLRSVGNCENCSDYIDLDRGVIVRNVGEYTFTGNEEIQLLDSDGVHQFYANNIISGDSNSTYNPISNRFAGIHQEDSNNNFNTVYLINDGKGIAVNLNNSWTVDEFKEFATENEVKVLYKLANSYETPLYNDNVYKTNPNYKVDITNMNTINPDYPISVGTIVPAEVVIE